VSTVVTGIAQQMAPGLLIAFAPLLGAGPLLLYSLMIAYTNDHLRPQQMVAASSALILTFGLGATFGPPSVGVLMDQVGPMGFLWVLAFFQLVIFGFTLFRMTRRPSMPVEEQSPYQSAPALSPPSGEWVRELAAEAEQSEAAATEESAPGTRASPS
jgi:MFS family permease